MRSVTTSCIAGMAYLLITLLTFEHAKIKLLVNRSNNPVILPFKHSAMTESVDEACWASQISKARWKKKQKYNFAHLA